MKRIVKFVMFVLNGLAEAIEVCHDFYHHGFGKLLQELDFEPQASGFTDGSVSIAESSAARHKRMFPDDEPRPVKLVKIARKIPVAFVEQPVVAVRVVRRKPSPPRATLVARRHDLPKRKIDSNSGKRITVNVTGEYPDGDFACQRSGHRNGPMFRRNWLDLGLPAPKATVSHN